MADFSNSKRNCLLVVAVATVVLVFLALIGKAPAQGKRACPAGFERTKQGCVKSTKKPAAACGANEIRRGRQCMCRPGFARQGKTCVAQPAHPETCGVNEVRRGQQCVCLDDYTRRDGVCVKGLPPVVTTPPVVTPPQVVTPSPGVATSCGANEIKRGEQCACAEGYIR